VSDSCLIVHGRQAEGAKHLDGNIAGFTR
jgi:hypothetical protein